MPTIRTTLNPREEVEVDEHDAEVLRHQGLLYEGSRDDLQALLNRDPIGRFDSRTVLPRETPTPAAITSTVADAKPTDTKGA
jgi:hypothetical protein